MNYDVFNGDADGLCAIQQIRLAMPVQATPVTGLKRDNQLLKRIRVNHGDCITVTDISLNSNRVELLDALDEGAHVKWFDHHFPGEPIEHVNLETHVEYDGNTCSSLIVYHYLRRHGHRPSPGWAITGAFGDAMDSVALSFAKDQSASQRFTSAQLKSLKELGILLNYNSYGETSEDIYIHPQELYDIVRRHDDPFSLMFEEPCISSLRQTYQQDFQQAIALAPEATSATGAIYVLPDSPWSRRISGTLGNYLLHAYPERAHAVLLPLRDSTWRISVRAPLDWGTGADVLCRRYPTGGGRTGAAGVDALTTDLVPGFVDDFLSCKWRSDS